MVRVKRSSNSRRGKGFISQMSLSMHFCVVMQFLAIVACVGFYMMLKSKEVRMMLFDEKETKEKGVIVVVV
jgi:hypothetical protein